MNPGLIASTFSTVSSFPCSFSAISDAACSGGIFLIFATWNAMLVVKSPCFISVGISSLIARSCLVSLNTICLSALMILVFMVLLYHEVSLS